MSAQTTFVASGLIGVYQPFARAAINDGHGGFIGRFSLRFCAAGDGFEHLFDRGAHGRAVAGIELAVFFRLPDTLFCLSRVGQVKTPMVCESRIISAFLRRMSIPGWTCFF